MDREYKDYLYHIKGSAVGMVIGLAVSLLVGAVVTLMSFIFNKTLTGMNKIL